MLGQPFWFYLAYTEEQWGVLVLCFVYTYVWGVGINNYWFPTSLDPSPGPSVEEIAEGMKPDPEGNPYTSYEFARDVATVLDNEDFEDDIMDADDEDKYLMVLTIDEAAECIEEVVRMVEVTQKPVKITDKGKDVVAIPLADWEKMHMDLETFSKKLG
jgi:prevent-host-death family protein